MKTNIDSLTAESIQYERAKLNRDLATRRTKGGGKAGKSRLLLAQGDSWFDYPPGLDIIYWLQKRHNCVIENFATAGDTLENMVHGTKFSSSNWRRYPSRMSEIIDFVSKKKPPAVLFSAGGNDLAGAELDAFFDHANQVEPGESALREKHLMYIVHDVFFKGYCKFIDELLLASGDSPLKIVGHTYAYPIPDGRAVINVLGFRWFGPWLRPTFTRKGHENLNVTIGYMKKLIDELELMLAKVRNKYGKQFCYADFRQVITPDDWANELHLTNSAYRRCAEIISKLL